MTDADDTRRSFDPTAAGQITDTPSVKQPMPLRSNDRALKKISLEFNPEEKLEKKKRNLFCFGFKARFACCTDFSRNKCAHPDRHCRLRAATGDDRSR